MGHDGAAAAQAWARQVRAGRQQLERLREVEEPADFYGPMAGRFALDPHRTGDAALEILRSFARSGAVWLDIGAGGGRYALPIALRVGRVVAVEPSPAMRDVLRTGAAAQGITNLEVVADAWPPRRSIRADVALMAHVGYDIEAFGAFLDSAEAAAPKLIAVMRASGTARLGTVLFPLVHGEPRRPYPMLPELRSLLAARGAEPTVTLVEREPWGFGSRRQLLETARRLLYLRPDSAKDRLLQRAIEERATERDGRWDLDWTTTKDGVVTWSSAR